MGKVFADQSMSLDGFSAGPNVRMDNGMGDGGETLRELMFHAGGKTGHRGEALEDLVGSTGAVVVGRRTFDLGEKPWADNPAFHRPVFVATHRPKAVVTKQGGTTYTFVTGGLEAAVAQARATAGDRDVVVLGGATIIHHASASVSSASCGFTSCTSCSVPEPACSAAWSRPHSRSSGRD